MRLLLIGLSALALCVSHVVPASAAWNNVFQPTLFRRPAAVSQYYVPPVVVQSSPVVQGTLVTNPGAPCTSCQQPQQTACSTSYVQRCYYQPCVTMTTQSYYEPVTTYKTSYYYEQVCSYRYSCYYDPCTCSYQQVATPTTSYQLRSKCCPVQSWVQRCCQVPVTTYQKSCYWEPRTTCCSTTVGAPIPCANGNTPPAAGPPQVNVQQAPAVPAPSITQPTPTGPPVVNEQRQNYGPTGNTMYNNMFPPSQPAVPAMPPASFKNPGPASPPQPPVKLEGIVAGPGPLLQGQVVRSDSSPKANAKVMFVSAQSGERFVTNANSAGRFHVALPAGGWDVYLHGANDLPLYQSRINVSGSQPNIVTLVSNTK